MNALLSGAVPVEERIAATLLNALWQDALIVLVVALLLRLWPRLNAATRYAAWLAALIAAIVVPVITTQLVTTRPAPTQAAVSTRVSRLSHIATRPLARQVSQQLPSSHVAPPAVEPNRATSSLARIRIALPPAAALAIVALWLLVAFAFGVRLAASLVKLERLKRNALPLPFAYRDALARWSDASRNGREVRFCISDETEVPVAVGLFDAMILLPRHLIDSLSQEELEQVCLHEAAHLRRGDDWTNLLQRVLGSLLWFSPAIYAAGRGLDLEREVACDDDVVTETGAVRPYAQCLTRMAEVTTWPHRALAAPGVFVTRRGISERVERLLRAGRNAARGLSLTPTAIAVAALVFLGLALRAVSPLAAAPVEGTPVAEATARPAIAAKPAVAHHHAVVRTGSVNVHVPEVDVNVPPVDVRVPAVDVNVPGVSVRVPPIDVHVPAMHVPAGKGCTGCDLSNIDWSNRDLHGRSFPGTDFSDAKLVRVNLAHADLAGVDFSNADLRGASFRDAMLEGCDLSNANVRGVDFSGANVQGCGFSGTAFDASQVRNILASCTGCDMDHQDLAGANLSGLTLSGDEFSHSNLRNVNFSDATLTGIDFSHSNLDGARFRGATLTGCDFGGVNLSRVDLSGAKMIGVDLSGRSQ